MECFAPLLDAGAAASAAAAPYAAPNAATSAGATKQAQPGDEQIIRILTRSPGVQSRDNRVSLRFLLQFLNRVVSSSATMGATNLAICFAPTVMRRTADQDSAAVDPATQMRDVMGANKVFARMIELGDLVWGGRASIVDLGMDADRSFDVHRKSVHRHFPPQRALAMLPEEAMAFVEPLAAAPRSPVLEKERVSPIPETRGGGSIVAFAGLVGRPVSASRAVKVKAASPVAAASARAEILRDVDSAECAEATSEEAEYEHEGDAGAAEEGAPASAADAAPPTAELRASLHDGVATWDV